MDKIRKSNSYLQDLEPEPENNLKTQLIKSPKHDDKIDLLMNSYRKKEQNDNSHTKDVK